MKDFYSDHNTSMIRLVNQFTEASLYQTKRVFKFFSSVTWSRCAADKGKIILKQTSESWTRLVASSGEFIRRRTDDRIRQLPDRL